jgi:putative transposase
MPMAKGFFYLVAIMDWHSRKILSWRLSNTMGTDFCIDALEEAIKRYGAPEIFNTDQGAQFTRDAFTEVLKASNVKISMEDKGRWVDNVRIERFWRSLKYEDVYLKAYDSVNEAGVSIRKYIDFYKAKRKHQTLEKTSDQVYFGIEALPKAT